MNSNHVTISVIAIKHAIDENPLSRASLKKLAPEIHVGRNQLQAAFKQVTGKTMRRYRLEKRMEVAATMLINGEATVKEVAIACGHAGSLSSFSKLFKAIYKMCPDEWAHKDAPRNNIRAMNAQIKKCI